MWNWLLLIQALIRRRGGPPPCAKTLLRRFIAGRETKKQLNFAGMNTICSVHASSLWKGDEVHDGDGLVLRRSVRTASGGLEGCIRAVLQHVDGPRRQSPKMM